VRTFDIAMAVSLTGTFSCQMPIDNRSDVRLVKKSFWNHRHTHRVGLTALPGSLKRSVSMIPLYVGLMAKTVGESNFDLIQKSTTN